MKSKVTIRNRQAGLTMPELVVAVIIGVILVAGAIVLVGTALSQHKLSKAESGLSSIRLNIEQIYDSQGNYTGLTNAVAYASKAFPTDMAVSATNIHDQWDGAVTVTADTNPTMFDIEFDGLPQDICVKMSAFGFGQWQTVTTNGTSIPQTPGSSPTSTAATACTAGNTNKIIWVTT